MAQGLRNPELLGAFYSRMGQCEYSFGNFGQAIQRMTKAPELCESAGNAEEAGYAYAWLTWSHLYRGDFERVLALKEDLLRVMEQRFNPLFYVNGVCAASRAYICLGCWDESAKEARKALKVAEEFSDNGLITFATWSLMMTYTWKGDLARAVEYGELAVQKAQTPASKRWAQRGLALAWCRAGEPKRGIEVLTDALATFRAGNYMPGVIPTTCTLGEGYWLAGEVNKARQTLEEGLEIANRCGARYYAGFAQRLLGEIALKINPDQAAAHFEKSIALIRKIKAENELALAYAGYGRLQMQQGQFAQAREYLTKALEVFERLGTLIEPDKVREILAELPEA
jgi:tetratricopeptide (TPR) repeat protein